RPQNPKELLNLCHAQAHNCVEQIFGVFKRWFCILSSSPEYSLGVQACIPTALCMVHNFIQTHNVEEIED
ncbi:hypothetical protein SERLA73DRAFT_27261, partial [Serpula lacrymans var. lacrymans S7.3]